MSNPHISSEDNSKENTHKFVLPSTSLNAFLDALTAPANNSFENISEGSKCEEEDEEFHLKDTSTTAESRSRRGGGSRLQKYKPEPFHPKMDNVSIISANAANSLSVEELTVQINAIVEQIKHLKTRKKDINESSEAIDIVEKRLLLRRVRIKPEP